MWAVAVVLLALGLFSLAAPVVAQTNINIGDSVQYNAVCQNIIGRIGDINQSQLGSANANASAAASGETTGGANASAEAVAEVAQEQGVSIAQVNECLNGAADNVTPNNPPPGGDTTGGDTTGGNTTGDNTTGGNTTSGGNTVATNSTIPADVIIKSIPDQKVLADTGGSPLVLLPAFGLLFLTAGATMLRVLMRH